MVLFPLLSRTGVNWILVTKLTTFRSGNSAGDEKETTNILDEFRARHRCNFQQVGSRERERQHIFYLFHHWTKSRLFVLLDIKYICLLWCTADWHISFDVFTTQTSKFGNHLFNGCTTAIFETKYFLRFRTG